MKGKYSISPGLIKYMMFGWVCCPTEQSYKVIVNDLTTSSPSSFVILKEIVTIFEAPEKRCQLKVQVSVSES